MEANMAKVNAMSDAHRAMACSRKKSNIFSIIIAQDFLTISGTHPSKHDILLFPLFLKLRSRVRLYDIECSDD